MALTTEDASNRTGGRLAGGGDVWNLHKLALPVMAEYLLQSLLGTVDIYFAKGLGDEAIAAISLTNLVMNIFIAAFTAVSVGVTSLVARCVGREDPEGAGAAARQSLLLGTALGLATGVGALVFREPLLRLSGAEEDILSFALPYFVVVAGPSVFLCVLTVLSACLRASEDSLTPMLASSGANAVNILLNWLLIRAGLGIVGLGLATTLSRVMAAGLLLGKLLWGRGSLRLRGGSWRPDKRILGSVIRIGLPACGEKLVMRLGQLVYAGLIISLGTASYVAHNVTGNIELYVCIPALGFGVATATEVGVSLGKKSPERARRYVYLAMEIAGVYTVLLSAGFYILAPAVAVRFAQSAEAQGYIVQLLHFIAFFEVFNVSAQVLTNALQGAGDTMFPMLSTLFGIWGIRVALGYLLAIRLGLGLIGIWSAYVLDIILRSVLLFLRFRQGKWTKIRL